MPALAALADRRPRFLGLARGLPQATRAAALRALGDIGASEARAVLQRALRSRGKEVRAAARLVPVQPQRPSAAAKTRGAPGAAHP